MENARWHASLLTLTLAAAALAGCGADGGDGAEPLGSGGAYSGTGGGPLGGALTGGSPGATGGGAPISTGGGQLGGSSSGGSGGVEPGGSGGGPPAGGGTVSGGASGSGGQPGDCAAISDHDGWELCASGPGFCAAVFTDGAGCAAVCAAAGLPCSQAFDNGDGCGPLDGSSDLGCGAVGHESDYCICGTGGGTGGTGGSGGTTGGSGGTTGGSGGTTGGSGGTTGGSGGTAGGSGGTTGGSGGTTGGSGGTTGGSGGTTGGSGGTTGGSGGGQQPDIGPGPCGCTTPAGEYSGNNLTDTIVVEAGEVYDGHCMIYRADPSTLGPGDQSEGQQPLFQVNGGTLRNVIIGASGADGIHVSGDATLENIHWLDIGEDAMTVKGSGTIRLNCGSSNLGEDKTFQVNAASTIYISNFTARNAGKFMRQNGGTTFEMSVFIDHSDISNMGECIYRTDSTSSHVTLTNSRYSNLGDGLFIFGSDVVNGNSDQSTVSNNQEY